MGKSLKMRTGAALVSAAMGLALIPNIVGAPKVRADYFPKTQYNSQMGIKGIRSPLKPSTKDTAWKGDYVWFGFYDSNPIKFRVLSTRTDAYGGDTMLLDSDKVLFEDVFDDTEPYTGDWDGSHMQQVLNGDFLKKFTDIEKASIITSKMDGGVAYPEGSFEAYFYGASVGVNDQVFLLDLGELFNTDYGYFADIGVDDGWSPGYYDFHTVKNHVKSNDYYWMRSKFIYDSDWAACVYPDGGPGERDADEAVGVAPAMNIDLDAILLNSCVLEKSGSGSEYKLTLIDQDMGISLTEGELIERSDTRQFKIPYTLTGAHADRTNCVRVLILDKEYQPKNANNAKIIYYNEIDAYLSGTSAVATFDFPDFVNIEGWGESYHVYILAEQVDATVYGEHRSDYASVPVEIPAPWRSVTIDISNGVSETLTDDEANAVLALAFDDVCKYYASSKYFYLDLDSDGNHDVMIPFNTDTQVLYQAGDTNLEGTFTFTRDQLKSTMYKEITFVFDRALTLTFDANGGSGTMDPIPTYVGEMIVLPECAFTPPVGMKFLRWNCGAPGETIRVSSSEVITAQWTPIMYSITVTSDGNGTAWASPSTAAMGTSVTLLATPNAGYKLKEYQVISGGVTITGDSFVIGACDVVIKAIFEVAPNEPEPQPIKAPSFEDFVERLYTVALGRASEPEGKAFWVDQVVNKGFTGADCARFFMLGAPEFLGRNLTDDEFVEVLYKTYFDRASEPDGKAYWMGRLASGTERAVLVEEFIESVEWCNVCASYGVKSGAKYHKATTPSYNSYMFATRLYTWCLGRDPEIDGLDYWALALTNLEVSGYQAASLFFTSDEFIGLKTTNEDYLVRLYLTFMDREPEVEGFTYWLSLLNAGIHRNEVMRAFAGCPEFQQICNQYGIERGEI